MGMTEAMAKAALHWQRVEGVHALRLRHADGRAALDAACAAAGLPALPGPGCFSGNGESGGGPWLVWRSPSEWLFIGGGAEAKAEAEAEAESAMRALQRALAPGRHTLACAIDGSDGVLVLALQSPQLDQQLAHLADASAIPQQPGQATTLRLAQVPVCVLRTAPERAWLVVDLALGDHVLAWLQHIGH